MKNITPNINEAQSILENIKNIYKRCENFFNSKDIDKKQIEEDFIYLENKIVYFYRNNNLPNEELIKVKLLFKTENNSVHSINYIWNSLGKIQNIISKYNTKENKIKEVLQDKLKLPVRWQDIIFYFDGNNLDIYQKDKLLGKYSFEELYFPAPKNKDKSSVRSFFNAFIYYDSFDKNTSQEMIQEITNKIKSNYNKNQRLKSDLKNILCELFHINEDPFDIDTKNKIYKPKYKVKLSGDLRINNHISGGKYNDNYNY